MADVDAEAAKIDPASSFLYQQVHEGCQAREEALRKNLRGVERRFKEAREAERAANKKIRELEAQLADKQGELADSQARASRLQAELEGLRGGPGRGTAEDGLLGHVPSGAAVPRSDAGVEELQAIAGSGSSSASGSGSGHTQARAAAATMLDERVALRRRVSELELSLQRAGVEKERILRTAYDHACQHTRAKFAAGQEAARRRHASEVQDLQAAVSPLYIFL
eukprot:tig00000145_g8848.t1